MKNPFYVLMACTVATTTALSSVATAQSVGPLTQNQSADFVSVLDQQRTQCLAQYDTDTCRERFYDVEEFAQKLQMYVVFGQPAASEQNVLHAFFDQPDTIGEKSQIIPAATHFTQLSLAQYDRAKKFEFDAHDRLIKSKSGKAHDRLLKIEFAVSGAVIGYFVGAGVFVDEAAATALGFLGSLLGYGTGAGVIAYKKRRTSTCVSSPSAKFDPELCLIKR